MPTSFAKSLAMLLVLLLATTVQAHAQTAAEPIAAEARQAPAAAEASGQPTAAEIFERFRAWSNRQDSNTQAGQTPPLELYRGVLADQGLDDAEIDERLRLIREHEDTLIADRWNRILTSPKPRFNTEPNAFLASIVEGEVVGKPAPGKALDVGMGQGRNAIYLASQGWQVTGFDPADKAVAVAEQEAQRLGLELETFVQRDDEFDFGTDQWDLIVLSYVSLRHLLPDLHRSLKAGGLVMVEAFHRDAAENRSIGRGVVFDTNELLELFAEYRIVRYEDTPGAADFGRRTTRLVRLLAQK